MSEKGSKPNIPTGVQPNLPLGANGQPIVPLGREGTPTREQANTAKWAKKLGGSVAGRIVAEGAAKQTSQNQHPDTSADALLDRRIGMTEATAAVPGRSLLDNLDRQLEIAEMQAGELRARVLDRDFDKEIEERRQSPEVAALNERARLYVYGNKGRKYVDPTTGRVIVEANVNMPGRLREIAMDERYGKDVEQSAAAAKKYEKRLEDLQEEGFEFCQAVMIAENEDPIKQEARLSALVKKRVENGQKRSGSKGDGSDSAYTQAKAQLNKANQHFIDTIRDNGIMTLAELDELRGKKQRQDPQTANGSANTVPLPRRNINDPASRAQLPAQPSRTDLHNANRAQRSQEKKNWKRRIAIGAAAVAGVALTVGAAIWGYNHFNDKTPEKPAVTHVNPVDRDNIIVTPVETDGKWVSEVHVQQSDKDPAAAYAEMENSVDSAVAKGDLTIGYNPNGTWYPIDNRPDAQDDSMYDRTKSERIVEVTTTQPGSTLRTAPGGVITEAEEDK